MSIPRYVGVGVAALVVIGGGWFAVTAYGLSVRYGTADPCEMIATRITAEQADSIGVEGEPYYSQLMRQNREDTRKEGAWTCWRSVLFGTPTDAELDHAVIMEAHQIRRFWEWGEEGRESSRDLALLSTRRTDVEVVAQLLIQPDGYEIVRAALAEEPEFRPTVLAAIEKWCKWIDSPDACRSQIGATLGMQR
jgi:hypothetical protein